MSTLIAYIAIFIGAGIFDIAGGIPLDPLQIIWLNFVIDVPIAIALGFDEPGGGLMERSPRPVGAPVLSAANWIRLCVQGFVMTVGTLIAYQIGEANFDLAIASTMLLSTLSLYHLAAGLLARDQVNTIFRRDLVPGATQLRRYGFALAAMILVTEIGFLQRIFSLVDLTLGQWGICFGIALTLVVVEEVIKVFLRRQKRGDPPIFAEPARAAA
jgi:P-type Ca2+ transporter type 2C